MARLDGKVAIVTGAASGIGRAIAGRFVAEGARVLAADVSDAGLESLRSEVGDDVRCVRADVARDDDVRRLVRSAVEAYGGLDILVNNAGIAIFKTLEDTTEEEWDRVIAVNLKACYLGIRHATPALRSRGGGAIVNIASVHGFATAGGVGAYGASKHGVIGLTKAAALELASDNIRVNAVCPGAIDTPLMRSNLKAVGDEAAELEKIARSHPLGRVGSPDEIARAVVFLSSDDASFVTGAPYLVDGGYLARLP